MAYTPSARYTKAGEKLKTQRAANKATATGQALTTAKTAAAGFGKTGVAGRSPERKAARQAVAAARAANKATAEGTAVQKTKARRKAIRRKGL